MSYAVCERCRRDSDRPGVHIERREDCAQCGPIWLCDECHRIHVSERWWS